MYKCSNMGKRIPILFSLFSIVLLLSACVSEPQKKENRLISLVKARDIEGIKSHFNTDEIKIKDGEGLSVLHLAVLQNDPKITSYLLKMGAEIEELDPSGRTPLVAAAAENAFAAAQVLAEHNARLFAADTEGISAFQLFYEKKKTALILNAQTVLQKDDTTGKTPLHYAAEYLDQNLLSEILNNAGNSLSTVLQEPDAQGHTALALVYEKPEEKAAAVIADLLLRAGAEPLRGLFTAFEIAAIQHNYHLRFENGQTLLHIEAAAGNTGFVLFLLEKGIDVNAKNISNMPPLYEAIRNGHTATATVLLEAGALPNIAATFGNTALHLAITAPHRAELLPLLLAKNADTSLKDDYGETPLHTAVRVGAEAEVITTLLQAGANINERNKNGESPILLAVERNLAMQTAALANAGADIHIEDMQKRTPFTEALRSRNEDIVKNLVTEKNSMQQDSKGRNVLHLAVLLNAEASIINYLIERETRVNAADKAGNTPLHFAVANNNPRLGEILLTYQADIFYTNQQGESPLKTAFIQRNGRERWIITDKTVVAADSNGDTVLHHAASWGLTAMIPLIIRRGGNSNAKNTKGETPLFSAVKADKPETVAALFAVQNAAAVDDTARDFLGNTVLHAAIEWNAFNSAEMILKQYGSKTAALFSTKNAAGKTPLHIAAQQGNIRFLALFLAYKADINADDRDGRTPLIDAVLYGQNNTVLFLLNNRASAIRQDVQGRSALHEAVGLAPPPVIRAIRQAGGDPLARDSYGNTPLLRAFRMARPVLDAVLGPDTSLSNSDGETPLHIAVRANVSEETMQYLLSKHYPLNKRDRSGSTALTLAAKQAAIPLCTVLIQAGADPFTANHRGESAVSAALTETQTLLPLMQAVLSAKTDDEGNGLFHYAARYASAETIRRLLNEKQSGINWKNSAGESPFDIAIRWNRPEIAELFSSTE